MKNSYIVRAWGGRIVLPQEIMDQLNLSATTVLHVVACPHGGVVQDLVASPLPVSCWERTFRLLVYVAARTGALADVTEVLAQRQLNLLSAWSASTSASGEGCFTAVVEILSQPVDIDQLTKIIKEALEGKNALSDSDLFKGQDPLSLVRIVKLRVLAKIFDCFARGKEREHFTLAVENRVVNLHHLRRSDANSQPFDFINKATAGLGHKADYLILTPDTEERYLRIGMLAHQEYRKLIVPVEISGSPDTFLGYFAKVLAVLYEANINVINAHNQLLAKRPPKIRGRGARGEEKAEFSFTLDTAGTTLLPHDPAAARDYLAGRIKTSLDLCSSTKGANNTRLRGDDDIALVPLDNVSPLVFLATNAKPGVGLEPRHIAFVKEIIRRIKASRLHPVNVEIKRGNVLRSEVETLISLCPLLVSIYLPEDGTQLENSTGGARYAASDYTMFEEAHAAAKWDLPMTRIRHKDVYSPRFIDSNIEIVFDDQGHDDAYRRFEMWLKGQLGHSNYLKRCGECDLRKLDATERMTEDWINRDIEAWLDGPPAQTT